MCRSINLTLFRPLGVKAAVAPQVPVAHSGGMQQSCSQVPAEPKTPGEAPLGRHQTQQLTGD